MGHSMGAAYRMRAPAILLLLGLGGTTAAAQGFSADEPSLPKYPGILVVKQDPPSGTNA